MIRVSSLDAHGSGQLLVDHCWAPDHCCAGQALSVTKIILAQVTVQKDGLLGCSVAAGYVG